MPGDPSYSNKRPLFVAFPWIHIFCHLTIGNLSISFEWRAEKEKTPMIWIETSYTVKRGSDAVSFHHNINRKLIIQIHLSIQIITYVNMSFERGHTYNFCRFWRLFYLCNIAYFSAFLGGYTQEEALALSVTIYYFNATSF